MVAFAHGSGSSRSVASERGGRRASPVSQVSRTLPVRPADRRRSARSRQGASTSRSSRDGSRGASRVAARRSRRPRAADRALRREHRGGRGPRRRRAPRAGGGRVVPRGGRPTSRRRRSRAVTALTLSIVGGDTRRCSSSNRHAQARMRCETRLEIIPGATHTSSGAGRPRTRRRVRGGVVRRPRRLTSLRPRRAPWHGPPAQASHPP